MVPHLRRSNARNQVRCSAELGGGYRCLSAHFGLSVSMTSMPAARYRSQPLSAGFLRLTAVRRASSSFVTTQPTADSRSDRAPAGFAMIWSVRSLRVKTCSCRQASRGATHAAEERYRVLYFSRASVSFQSIPLMTSRLCCSRMRKPQGRWLRKVRSGTQPQLPQPTSLSVRQKAVA
jgi:hypothetical protein